MISRHINSKRPDQATMKRFTAYLLFLLFSTSMACVKKAEDIEGPTMGSLRILADESIKDIVEQEEEIFERFYPYARLDITYTNERDMFAQLLVDSIDLIMSTRKLNAEETSYLSRRQSEPRHFAYATSAIAFIANRNAADTAYTYEEMVSMLGDSASGRRDWISLATAIALIIVSFAPPGWMLNPVTVNFAPAALKFSNSISPSVPPSTV